MQYANGLIFGAGFSTAAVIILAVVKALFHFSIC